MAGETQLSSLSVDQVAFDRLAYFALRSELLFDQAADVQPVQQAMPGTGVTFTIFSDIAAATSTLNEVTDVTPTALSDSQVTVTLNEYGNAVVTTAKLRGTAFLDVDSAAANIIGYNAGDSIDQVVREVLAAEPTSFTQQVAQPHQRAVSQSQQMTFCTLTMFVGLSHSCVEQT